MEDGLASYETSVGILQHTAAAMSAAHTAAVTAEALYQSLRSGKPALTTAQTVADSNAKAFIATSRGVLANYLGSQWSEAWVATGFVNGSLAMPATVEERQALLFAQENYFSAQAAQEAPPLVTAVRALSLGNALAGARGAVNGLQVSIAAAKVARDAAVATLRKKMRGLIDELGSLIADDDARWYAFGLNRPADPQTPGIPDGLLVTPGTAGVLYIDWADSRRAEHYRVWKKVVGVDTEFTAVESVSDSDATLTGLPSGATVEIQITAVNDAGESVPSATVSAVVA